MERSERHRHRENRERIGEEFAEHQCTISTKTPAKRFNQFAHGKR